MFSKRDCLVACYKECKNHKNWVTVSYTPSSTSDVAKQFENLTTLDFMGQDKPPFHAIAVELAPVTQEDVLKRRMKTIRSLLADNGVILLIGQRPRWDIYREAELDIKYFLVGLNVILLTTGNESPLVAANLYSTHFCEYSKSTVLKDHFANVCAQLSKLRSSHPELSTLELSILANFSAYIEHRASRWIRAFSSDTRYSAQLTKLGRILRGFHDDEAKIQAKDVNDCLDETIRGFPSRISPNIDEEHIKLDTLLLEGKQAFNYGLVGHWKEERKEQSKDNTMSP